MLVMPRRKGACRGDRSAWLQYRPHMEKDAIPSAAVTRAAQASRHKNARQHATVHDASKLAEGQANAHRCSRVGKRAPHAFCIS